MLLIIQYFNYYSFLIWYIIWKNKSTIIKNNLFGFFSLIYAFRWLLYIIRIISPWMILKLNHMCVWFWHIYFFGDNSLRDITEKYLWLFLFVISYLLVKMVSWFKIWNISEWSNFGCWQVQSHSYVNRMLKWWGNEIHYIGEGKQI